MPIDWPTRLKSWPLPPNIFSLADGDLPRLAFEAVCEPLPPRGRTHTTGGIEIQDVEELSAAGNSPAIALWGLDGGDGHSSEVTFCVARNGRLEYWRVQYADDTDAPVAMQIARSEQGLYFWLFYFMIRAEFFQHGEAAYGTLVSAAKSVGFEHLIEVFKLEKSIGAEADFQERLSSRSTAIL